MFAVGTKPIPSTTRDATVVLDEVLDNETELPLSMHATDTAGYTELIFRKRYPDDQLNQAHCLNLVTNAVVVWNTVYMWEALDQLKREGRQIDEEDV